MYSPTVNSHMIKNVLSLVENQLAISLAYLTNDKGKLDKLTHLSKELFVQKNSPLKIDVPFKILPLTNGNPNNIATLNIVYMPQYAMFLDIGVWKWLFKFNINNNTKHMCKFIHNFGDSINAFWGTLDTSKTTRKTACLFEHYKSENTNQRLPTLKSEIKTAHPNKPTSIAWLNYWSIKTFNTIVVNPNHINNLFYTHIKSDHGVAYQLTQKALNFDNEEHLQHLILAYKHLPLIGNQQISR